MRLILHLFPESFCHLVTDCLSKIKFGVKQTKSREVLLIMTLTEAIPGVVKLGNLAGEHNIKLSDLNLPRPEQFKFVSRFSGIDSLLVVDLISCEMPRFLPRCIHNFQEANEGKSADNFPDKATFAG